MLVLLLCAIVSAQNVLVVSPSVYSVTNISNFVRTTIRFSAFNQTSGKFLNNPNSPNPWGILVSTVPNFASSRTFTCWSALTSLDPTNNVMILLDVGVIGGTTPLNNLTFTTFYLKINDASALGGGNCVSGFTIAESNPGHYSPPENTTALLANYPLQLTTSTISTPDPACFGSPTYCTDTLKLQWSNIPTNNNGYLNTGFVVYWSTDDTFPNTTTQSQAISSITTPSFEITGLTPGVRYYMMVAATNKYDRVGPPSATFSRISGNVPRPASNVVTTVLNVSCLSVSWTNGLDGGDPITNYRVDCSTAANFGGATTVTDIISAPSPYTFCDGLTTGRSYYCRVAPKNSFGFAYAYDATPGSLLLATIPSTPMAPTVSALSPTSSSINWTAPAENGAVITSYILSYSTSSDFSTGVINVTVNDLLMPNNPPTTYSLSLLTTNQTYFYRVFAVNVVGPSLPSLSTTFAQPGLATITTGSLIVVSGGSISAPRGDGSVLGSLTKTTGPASVSFSGNGFLRFAFGGPSTVTVQYTSGSLSYPCNVTSVSDTNIACDLSPGVGANFTFIVYSGTQQTASLTSLDMVSYPPPTITAGTLRRPAGSHANPLPALTALSEPVIFQGTNFGTVLALVQVMYGTAGSPEYTCTIQQLTDNQITCLTAAKGIPERGLVFRVTVGGQTSPTGSDVYDYPVAPIIYTVRGCPTVCGNGTCDCPTTGQITITIFGTRISDPERVDIRGTACTSVVVTAPDTIKCTLPVGTGLNQGVTAIQQDFSSTPQPYLSYALPNLYSVSGCNMTTGVPTDCNRAGGNNITIVGKNFGPSGARAFIAGQSCTTTTQDFTTPHIRLFCITPPGAGTDLVVSVIQGAGQLSIQTNVTLSYQLCPVGIYINGTQCTNCSVGTASDLVQQLFCPSCSEGKYANVSGSTACRDCPVGTFSPSGTDNCSPCPPGSDQPLTGQAGCELCALGKYKGSTGVQLCLDCPAGQHQNQSGSLSCVPCDPGTVSVGGAVQCTACDSGTYQDTPSQAICTPCNPGTYSIKPSPTMGATTCVNCTIGFYSTLGGQCSACDLGRFANVSGLSVCIDCDPGFYSNYQALTSLSTCLACQVGTFADIAGLATCKACDSGTYSSGSQRTECLQCGAGTFSKKLNTDLVGPTSCTNCTAGTSSLPGSAVCSQCVPGTFSNISGATLCAACDFNTISVPNALPNLGPTSCETCPAGATPEGGVVCVGCSAGRYSVSGFCFDCPAGRYQINITQTFCLNCTAGTFALTNGSVTCTQCPAGFYSLIGSTICDRCAVGTYSPGTGYSYCIDCDAGEYASAAAATQCYDCQRGTFSVAKSSHCTDCANGTFSDGSKSTVCEQCGAGFAALAGSTSCLICSAGSYSEAGQAECTECPGGTFSTNDGATVCGVCLAGQFASARASSCVECREGRFSDTTESAQCALCGAGTYQDRSSRTACQACPPGKIQLSNESINCDECPAGTYSSPTAGNGIACLGCPDGTWSEAGQSACTLCQEGAISNNDHTGCIWTYLQTKAVKTAFIVACIIGLAIVLITAILWIVFRNNRVVMFSAPPYMYLVMLGTALIFGSIILWIVDQSEVICHFKNILLNLGATIISVSIVIKTWHLHRLFNRSQHEALKTVRFSVIQSLSVLVVMVAVDLAILLIWWGAAPFEVNPRGQPRIYRCLSDAEPYIHAPLWGWKAALAIFTVWLTYQVRDIDERFNESRWLLIAIYNLGVVLAVIVILTIALQSAPPREWFIMFATLIFYANITTFILSFGPKFYRMYAKSHEYDELYGSEVAEDVEEAKEVLEREKKQETQEQTEYKKGTLTDDEKLEKLHKKRNAKAKELQDLLKIVDRSKQRMKTDIISLHRLSSDVV